MKKSTREKVTTTVLGGYICDVVAQLHERRRAREEEEAAMTGSEMSDISVPLSEEGEVEEGSGSDGEATIEAEETVSDTPPVKRNLARSPSRSISSAKSLPSGAPGHSGKVKGTTAAAFFARKGGKGKDLYSLAQFKHPSYLQW